jgi:hypothetical protein
MRPLMGVPRLQATDRVSALKRRVAAGPVVQILPFALAPYQGGAEERLASRLQSFELVLELYLLDHDTATRTCKSPVSPPPTQLLSWV